MLEHLHPQPRNPARVVVLGSRGFVGAAVMRRLQSLGLASVGLGRVELDLAADGAADRLAAALRPDDSVVFVSALAPCKTADQMVRNLAMVRAVCAAIERVPVAHLVNISSDAVYPASAETVSEATPAAAGDLHGSMHATREAMLRASCKAPLVSLRPSLLYGPADPHNGYGPNRFSRLAAEGKEIALFGEGEEQRDHVLVDDVAAIVGLCLVHRSRGVLNVATGRSLSFRRVAELIVAGRPVRIAGSARRNPILHRHFDTIGRVKAFPRFAFTPFERGLAHLPGASGAAHA